MAVSRSAAPLSLARALVRLAELRRPDDLAVTAASGSSLGARVRRLLRWEAPSAASRTSAARRATRGARWLVPLVGAVAVCGGGALLVWRTAPASDRLAVEGAAAGMLPSQRMLIDAHDPAGSFTITLLNGRVASATIAGTPIERRAVRVHGRQLRLPGQRGRPELVLDFDPRGAIAWHPRPQRADVVPRDPQSIFAR